MPIRKDFTISGIIFKNHTTYGSTYSTFTTADVHETNLTFRPHSQNDSKVAFYKRFHAIIALKRPWCHCPVSVCKVTQLIPSRSKSLPTPYQCYIPHLTFLFSFVLPVLTDRHLQFTRFYIKNTLVQRSTSAYLL